MENLSVDQHVKSGAIPAAREPGPLPSPIPRIERIRELLLHTPCSICLERPLLMERFEKSPEGRRAAGEHPFVRRAQMLAYIYANRKPRIYDDELIIGNMTSKRIAANYYPEGGSVNILEDIFKLERRQIPIVMEARERISMLRVGLRSLFRSIAGRSLLKPGRFSHFVEFFTAKRYFITEEAGISHQVVNYGELVRHGLRRADESAARCLETRTRPDGSPLSPDNEAFYRSVRITIEGIRIMALNLADEAERMASLSDTEPGRRRELLESAQALRHVPYEPARSLLEGLQSCWLVHIALNLEDFEQGLSFGRLDQILIDLYRRDLESGKLSRESALELLASFQLKTCETIPIYSERIDRYFSGNGVAQGITVGGTDMEGRDATNELSELLLEAYALIRTREPALHVRLHESSPRAFLETAVRVLQLGCGKPSFFGDAAVTRALEHAGIAREHARDYAVIGCVEMGSQGRTYNSSDAALFNIPICLELALNEGYRLMGTSLRRFGAKTPPVSSMRRFEDVVEAFRAQTRHSMSEMARVMSWLEESYRLWRTTPVNSILTEGCLAKGLDVTWGGAMYDLTSIQAVGLAEAGDSLCAIKKLVFDEKRMGLEELVGILKNNFRDHEPLRVELQKKFPRFGNGIGEADEMTQLACDVFADAVMEHRNLRGGRYVPGIYSMTCFIGFGKSTGALPNGRPAGTLLSNGLSPSIGADRVGPTGVLNSAASIDTTKIANCLALNLKFEKNGVKGERGLAALCGLILGYFKKDGMQVQINILDSDILRAAKADPSRFPGIVVRVAGYCAYFNDLQPDVQDEIIARTCHGLD